jgi:hypothetical protein
MRTKQKVDSLWRQFRTAVNASYNAAKMAEDGESLRDYAENISWHDAMSGLLGRETANERRHRSRRPSIPGFSNETAAKLVLMQQAADGSELHEMPAATEFLIFRQTAAEARVIGWLIREHITAEWRAEFDTLDYAELMKGKPRASLPAN